MRTPKPKKEDVRILRLTPVTGRMVAPAWVDATDGMVFTAVTPRVRDGLPLRAIAEKPAGAAVPKRSQKAKKGKGRNERRSR